MLPYLLLFGAGAGLSVYNKGQENKRAQEKLNREYEKLGSQKTYITRQYFLNKARTKAQMEAATTQANKQLRDTALEEFHQESQANAMAAATNMGEGTAYSNIMLMAKLLQEDAIGIKNAALNNLEALKIQGELGALEVSQNFNQLKYAEQDLEAYQDELNYNNSLVSYTLAAVSGGLNMVALGENLETVAMKATGNPNIVGDTTKSITESLSTAYTSFMNWANETPQNYIGYNSANNNKFFTWVNETPQDVISARRKNKDFFNFLGNTYNGLKGAFNFGGR